MITIMMIDEVKMWVEIRVAIMLDGWSDIGQMSIINFFVNHPNGTIFLKFVDASTFVKDAQFLFKMLDEVVETGDDIVVQLVINTSAYIVVGRMLMD